MGIDIKTISVGQYPGRTPSMWFLQSPCFFFCVSGEIVLRQSWPLTGSVQAPPYDIFWIATRSQALLELPKALFKCCFQRVSPMQSHCVTFNEAVFYALGVAWVQVCILKGVSRLLIGFIVQDGLAFESFASKHHCVEESNCVIWNLIRR